MVSKDRINKGFTQIQIKKETLEALKKCGWMGANYDDIIQTLLKNRKRMMGMEIEAHRDYEGIGTLFYDKQKIAVVNKMSFYFWEEYSGHDCVDISDYISVKNRIRRIRGKIEDGNMIGDFLGKRYNEFKTDTIPDRNKNMKFIESLDPDKLKLKIEFSHHEKRNAITIIGLDLPKYVLTKCLDLQDVEFRGTVAKRD